MLVVVMTTLLMSRTLGFSSSSGTTFVGREVVCHAGKEESSDENFMKRMFRRRGQKGDEKDDSGNAYPPRPQRRSERETPRERPQKTKPPPPPMPDFEGLSERAAEMERLARAWDDRVAREQRRREMFPQETTGDPRKDPAWHQRWPMDKLDPNGELRKGGSLEKPWSDPGSASYRWKHKDKPVETMDLMNPKTPPTEVVRGALDEMQGSIPSDFVLEEFLSPSSMLASLSQDAIEEFFEDQAYSALFDWTERIFENDVKYNPPRTRATFSTRLLQDRKWSTVKWTLVLVHPDDLKPKRGPEDDISKDEVLNGLFGEEDDRVQKRQQQSFWRIDSLTVSTKGGKSNRSTGRWRY